MFCRNMLQSASVCQYILSSINQPDESRCQKSLSEQVASSRSTEKLQNDVHNSIQLISKILSHGEAARWCPHVGVPAVEERAAKRYRRYSRMLRGASLQCYTQV